MQNIDVRFVATANFAQAQNQIAAMQKQMLAFQKQLESTMAAGAKPGQLVAPAHFVQSQRAVSAMSDAYRSAAASSGLLTTQQIKMNSEVVRYTELLQKQKLGMRQMIKDRRLMSQVFKDQLRMEKMAVSSRGTDRYGREIVDVTMPTNLSKGMVTLNDKMRFFNAMAKSSGEQMINLGKNVQWAGRQLTVGLTYPMILFAGAAGKVAYDIDKEFTRIAKVYDATGTAFEKSLQVQELRNKSMAMGKNMAIEYGASLKDVLKVEAQLAATGLSGERLLSGTRETVRIASLGEVDFTQATDMTVALQTAFKDTIKTSKDLTETFDYMNYVENTTSLSIQDIAEATPRAASGLASLGVTAKEMTVLLVAMREAGIDAAEGANALKSASTRILNVTPEAEARFAGALTGGYQNVQEIADKAGGNLFKFLQELAKATADMDEMSRQKGIAKLFGTYQYNRLNAALKGVTDSMFGFGDQTSQTAKAVQGLTMDSAELAAISAGEIAKQQRSASGQIKRSWENMKNELAEVGQSFLPMASTIMNVLTSIMDTAQDIWKAMPDIGKELLKWGTIGAAIAGPVIMTMGVIGNLAGWITKGIAASISLFTGTMRIFTTKEKAAQIQAENLKKTYLNEAEAVRVLKNEILALSQAQQHSINVARGIIAPAAGARMAAAGMMSPTGGVPRVSESGASNVVMGMGSYGSPIARGNKASGVYAVSNIASKKTSYRQGNGAFASKEQIEAYKKQMAISSQIAATESNILRTKEYSAAVTAKTAEAQGAVADRAQMGAKSAAVMQGAMVASLVTSGKLQTVLMGVSTAMMAVQAAQMLATTKLGVGVAASWAGAGGKMGGFLTKAKSGFTRITGLATKFGKALLGPWGLAITGAGLLAGFIGKKLYDAYKKPERRQEAINDATKDWVKTLGIAEKKYKDINLAFDPYNAKTSTQKLADQFKKTKSGKAILAEMEEGKTDEVLVVQREYIRLLKETTATAEDAEQAIAAMYIASGDGVFEAARKAKEIRMMLGDEINITDFTSMWGKEISEALGAEQRTMDERGKRLAGSLISAIKSESDRTRHEGIILAFQASIDGKNLKEWASDLPNTIDNIMRERGETNIQAEKTVQQMAQSMMSDNQRYAGVFGDQNLADDYEVDIKTVMALRNEIVKLDSDQRQAIANSAALEAQVIKTLKEELGIKGNIYTMDQLMATDEMQVHTTTKQNVRERVELLGEQYRMQEMLMKASGMQMDEDSKQYYLQQVNLRLQQAGYDVQIDSIDQIQWALRQVGTEQEKNVSKTKKLTASLKAAADAAGGIRNITMNIQTNVTNAVAQEAESQLQAAQQAESDALDRSISAHSDALDRKAEATDAHFDRLIEKTNEYYDRRIERINSEIEAEEKANDTRKRLFEAELTRMQRLADAKNRNIDINMAINSGNLDEAAKLMNDTEAQQIANLFEDEEKAADAVLEGRRASLEKQIDVLEKQRDLKIKALEEDRAAARKAIDNAKKRWEEEGRLRKAALQREQADRMSNYQKGLELLRTFIPRNKKELLDYMAELDKKYGIFGGNLKANATKWGNFIGKETNHQLDLAARRMNNEVNWKEAGYEAADELIAGLAARFGMSKTDFQKAIGIGSGGDFKESNSAERNGTNNPNEHMGHSNRETRHAGGQIGGPGSTRAGKYAGSPSARNEVNVLAERGEYMLSRKAVSKYGTDTLDAINDGRFGVGGASPAGVMGAVAARATMAMATKKINEWVNSKMGPVSSGSIPGFGPITQLAAGKYGGTNFDNEQLRNAGIIAREGKGMGMSNRDIIIGLMTAMQESVLRNLKYGDRDSLGLFQQRPSQGWGTPEQVTDPVYASRKFFSVLKTVKGRESMALTEAAQAVQRSGYPYAYAKWEDEARAIAEAWRRAGGSAGGGFVQGGGGKHRPVDGGSITQGIHGNNGIDIGVPVGRRIFAVADGRVSDSYDIPGYEPRASHGGLGYKSYGRVVKVDHGGFDTLYAHLSQRSVSKGMSVRGGAVLGKSGNTGNSSGPHLHFEAHGRSPYDFVSLRKGGEIRWDNTMANLHRGETVLTAPLTRQFKENVANGGGDQYDITIDLRGAVVRDDLDIKAAVYKAIDERESKLGRKRVAK